MSERRYNVTLGSNLDKDLDQVAAKLQVSKAEAMRRALLLFKHAVDAKSVKLTADDGSEQAVLIK
jgi:hypothetical protein